MRATKILLENAPSFWKDAFVNTCFEFVYIMFWNEKRERAKGKFQMASQSPI